jgi:hypothetical protein
MHFFDSEGDIFCVINGETARSQIKGIIFEIKRLVETYSAKRDPFSFTVFSCALAKITRYIFHDRSPLYQQCVNTKACFRRRIHVRIFILPSGDGRIINHHIGVPFFMDVNSCYRLK